METVDKPKVYRIWDTQDLKYVTRPNGKTFWKTGGHAKCALQFYPCYLHPRSRYEIHEFNLEFTQRV